MVRRLYQVIAMAVAMVCASVSAMAAQEAYGSTGPFSKEFTHQYLHGATYRSRFTIEGAIGIQPDAQGVSEDHAYLVGYADPNGTITVTMEWIECTDPSDDLQWKQVDVWMGNRYTNGDAMRDDDNQQFTKTIQTQDNGLNKVVFTFNCADYLQADPRAPSPMLVVNASTTVQVGGSVSETVVYLKLILDEDAAAGGNGLHVTEDHEASEENGSKKYLIPGVIGSVIIGGGAAAAALTGRKPKEEGEGGEEEGEGEEPDEEPDWLEMEIYKDFGDTLIVGDGAEMVSACIIRHSADGRSEWVDEALTQRIQISSIDQYLYVEEHGMVNGWKTAYVAAPECEEGQPPEESIVQFQIASAEASYTNRLHFKVMKPEVKFDQENLTLPAYYEKQVELPFDVIGINDGTAILKATILDDTNQETQNYSIEAAWDEKKQRYFATIRDQVLDPNTDIGIAGNYLEYSIRIEARNKTGLVIEGSLPLYRYYMGLVMRMRSNVHCYLEEYNPMRHASTYKKRLPDGKEYAPAEQDCYLKLYGYDEKQNGLYVIDPEPVDVKWTVVNRDNVLRELIGSETMQMGLDTALTAAGMGPIGTLVSEAHSSVLNEQKAAAQRVLEFQKLLDGLGLSFEARWQTTGEGRIYYVLRSVKGVLNAPNRFDAEMEVTARYKGKTYTFTRIVHLLSQPQREYASMSAYNAALERDNKIQEGLWTIESGIQAAGLNDKLAPLLYFIRLQQDFYDAAYGYDERNIKAIQKCYLNALKREADEAAVEAKEATAADNLEWYTMDWWLQRSFEGHDLLENMHWAKRIGFAIASLGFTEIVFNVPAAMKKYVDEGGESRLGAFFVGAKIAVEAYLIEAGITIGIGAIGAVGARGLKGLRAAKAGAKSALKAATKESLKSGGKVAGQAMKNTCHELFDNLLTESWTGLKTWGKSQISWQVGAAERAIASRAKSLLDGVKSAAKNSKYAAAEGICKRQAIENLENLQTMMELCRWNPTSENYLLRNKIIMQCQADKQTMMLLKNPELLKGESKLLYGVDFNATRQEFNGMLRIIYNVTDRRVIQTLADAEGIAPELIQVFGATSSSGDDLVKGLTITFDRDVTYYYIKGDKPYYFNQEYVESLYAKYFRESVNTSTMGGTGMKSFDPSKLTPEALKKLEELETRQAAIASRMADQTVIEDVLRHFESYGDDLPRLINKDLFGEALKNPAKVAEAVLHKGMSRFNFADDLWRQGEMAGGIVKKQLLQSQAVSEMMEGCRQMKKVFKILKDRDAVRNTVTKIPDDLKLAIDVIENLDGVTTTLSQAEVALSKAGYTFQSLAKGVSNLVYLVG
ncbi:MAG: hypothetical protein J6Y38_01020 [Bacteroidaceae bacterium]|nr:hypothetical protein [Bacteroidaceae bacterium]